MIFWIVLLLAWVTSSSFGLFAVSDLASVPPYSHNLLAISAPVCVRAMADDLEDNIRDNAKASGDAGRVEQHNLKDQIGTDKYLA